MQAKLTFPLARTRNGAAGFPLTEFWIKGTSYSVCREVNQSSSCIAPLSCIPFFTSVKVSATLVSGGTHQHSEMQRTSPVRPFAFYPTLPILL